MVKPVDLQAPFVFLGHAGADTGAAQDIAAVIRKRGMKVWLDVEQLKPGDNWITKIESAINHARAFLVYVGKLGVQRWVDNEVRVALDRKARDPGFHIVPVLGPGVKPNDLPAFLRLNHSVDWQQDDGARELLELINGDAQDQPFDGVPFPGLAPFGEDGAVWFNGREQDVLGLLERMGKDAFLAVTGDSGCGKSSLVTAGLIPSLRHGRFVSNQQWVQSWRIGLCRLLERGPDPFLHLACAFREAGLSRDLGEIKRSLEASPYGILQAVLDLKPASSERVLIVIDQFEQLFTLDEDIRIGFIQKVVEASKTAAHAAHFVVVLRTDFLPDCKEVDSLREAIERNQFRVTKMARKGLMEAIKRPLALARCNVDDPLADALIDDFGDDPGNLALLQHTLSVLWQEHSGSRIDIKDYYRAGRLQGALRDYADRVCGGFTREQRDLVRRIFLFLVHAGELPERDALRNVEKRELLQKYGGTFQADEVLRRLEASRMITVLERRGGSTLPSNATVQIAHVALIRHWPTLQRWVDERRDALRYSQTVDQSARDWDRNGRDPTYLYRGLQLSEAQHQLSADSDAFSPAAVEFLTQGAKEANKQAHREKRIWKAIAGVVAFVVVGALLGFGEYYHLSQREESRQLAALALQDAGTEPRALRRALDAGRHAKTEEAEAALGKALGAPIARFILHHGGEVQRVAISPDDGYAATLGVDGQCRLWDTATGALKTTFWGHTGRVLDAEFSQDGKWLVTASADRTARIWSVADGEQIRVLAQHKDALTSVRYSNRGTVLTASLDKTAIVWSAGDGHVIAILAGHKGAVQSASFDRSGLRVITASYDGTARIWRADNGQCLKILQGRDSGTPVWYAAFSPNGDTALTVSGDEASIWSATTGALRSSLTGHAKKIWSAAFSTDGDTIVTASSDATARLWSAATGRTLATLGGHEDEVRSATFSKDGHVVATASSDGTARLWNMSGSVRGVLAGHSAPLVQVALLSRGDGVVTVDRDGVATVWNAAGASLAAVLEGHTNAVRSMMFSPDRRKLVSTGVDSSIKVWDIEHAIELVTWSGREHGHNGPVESAAFSSDGKRIVTANSDGTSCIWSSKTGSWIAPDIERLVVRVVSDSLREAVFSKDGTMVLTTGLAGEVLLWDAERGHLITKLPADRGFRTAHMLPGGQILTAAADGSIQLWSARNGALIETLGHLSHQPNQVVLSNDLGRLLGSGAGEIQIFDLHGRCTFALPGEYSSAPNVALSPDGQFAAVAAYHEVRVWDVENRHSEADLKGHKGLISYVAFSPDGGRVMTASEDGTARIWNAHTGHLLHTLAGQGKVVVAAISADGKRAAVASQDGQIRIYAVDFDDLLGLAKSNMPKEVFATVRNECCPDRR